MLFEWELPLWLQTLPADTGYLTGKDFIFNTTTLVVRGKCIEATSCKQYLEKFHPERGVELVEAIVNALSALDRVIVKKDMIVKALNNSLMIEVFDKELQAEIKDIAVLLCLAFRMPKTGRALLISTGSFAGNTFTMATRETALKGPPCWVKLFNNAVVVVKPFEHFPKDGLLKLSFGDLVQLTGVEYPVMLGSGLVLMGYRNALVPMGINEDGQILWHLEGSSRGEQFRISELQAVKRPWLQRQTLEELQTPEALLGWCASAESQKQQM